MKNRFKIMVALRLLSLAGLLCLPVHALGESILPFDLDASAGMSKIVAHGELHPDGTLRVIEAFKGKPEGSGDLQLEPSAAEESVLAGLLRNAGSDGDRARVLRFIGSIHGSRALYPEVLPWVDVKVPRIPRQQAFTALASIDSFAAAEVLSHFLSLDDPLIADVLAAHHSEWMREPCLLNLAVLEPLLAFSRQVLIKSHSRDERERNFGYSVLPVLQHYFHPTLLPLMIEWANDKEVTTSAQAMSHFGRSLGFLNERADPERIAKWWAQNRDVVMRHHDLSSWAGVNVWLQAWRQSDDRITKHVLLRLWDFTPGIPEHELLNACEGESGAAAKELLSELWQRKRLTAATRKAIVAKYMKMRIVERPCVNSVDPNVWRERHVAGDRLFPFPHDTGVVWTGEITTDREPKISEGSSNGCSLEGSGLVEFVGGTGKLGGPFKAILELWEMDYQATPPQELWRLHWALDQDSKKPVGPIAAEGATSEAR